MAVVTAFAADSFVNAVGVNTHSNYGANPTNAYGGNWLPLVSQLGIRHVRETYSPGSLLQQTSLATLASEGVGITLALGGGQTSVSSINANLTSLVNSSLPTPEGVEGWNEHDSAGASWASEVQTFQPTLYGQIKSRWPSANVLGASLIDNTRQSQVGSLSAYTDVNNVHAYEPPAQTTEYAPLFAPTQSGLYTTQATGKPLWITETGLVNGSLSDPATLTSELSAARLIPRTLLYTWAPTTLTTVAGSPYPTGTGGLGAAKTFIYELLDEHNPTEYSPATEDRFGLFNKDLTPKLAASALGNLISLLNDPGTAFTPGTLDVTVTGGGAPFSYILFQKRDGSFWLAYWMGDPTVNDPLTAQSPDMADAVTPITFTFGQTFQGATVYRPLSGTAVVQHASAINSIVVNARLDVQILKLAGQAKPGSRPRGIRSYYDSRSNSLG